MMDAQKKFKQWDNKLNDLIDKLVIATKDYPLPVELEPGKLQSQVDNIKVMIIHYYFESTINHLYSLQDTFLQNVWPLLDEMSPLLATLESNKAKLANKDKADTIFEKYRKIYKTAELQKSELEQIKLRADNYSKPFESISKWITETETLLVKAKPLAALPILVEEQLTTVKVRIIITNSVE